MIYSVHMNVMKINIIIKLQNCNCMGREITDDSVIRMITFPASFNST